MDIKYRLYNNEICLLFVYYTPLWSKYNVFTHICITMANIVM